WLRNAVDSVLAPVAELTGADEEKASEPVEAVPPAAGEEDPAKGTPKAAVVLDPLGVAVKRTVSVVGGTARALLAIGLFVSIFLFAFVPLSSRFPAVSHWLLGLVPEAYRAQAIPLLKRMDEIISGFVR